MPRKSSLPVESVLPDTKPDMARPMLRFVSVQQKLPEKRPAAERKQDFCEIYKGFDLQNAEEQASRCSQCGIPFCSAHCPLGNDIPDWLRLATAGRLEEAYALSSATNSFPEICGRICPQDRLCEGNCVINKDFQSVTIGAVERFITETAFQEGWAKPAMPLRERGQSVGIVGAGPAGLACAERLRAEGYSVSVYERNPKPGGLLMYGIPGFKLEKEIVERRWRMLEAQGVRFVLNCTIADQTIDSPAGTACSTIGFSDLRQRHDALFLATGVYRARNLNVPGATLEGVVEALAFLIASQHEPEKHNMAGKRVIVLGGGDTAMDCVRTALRQGAAKVTCVYRRDRANMPGSRQEVRNAEEEGGYFHWLAAPESLLGEGHVRAVRVREMRLGVVDQGGRRAVEPTGHHTLLDADAVISALGFEAEDWPELWQEPGLQTMPWGTLAITGTGENMVCEDGAWEGMGGKDMVERGDYETSLPGIFAGGDMTRGASLVVWAIRDGREAANAIHKRLERLGAKVSPG